MKILADSILRWYLFGPKLRKYLPLVYFFFFFCSPSFIFTEGVGKYNPTNISRMFQSPLLKVGTRQQHVKDFFFPISNIKANFASRIFAR